MVCMMCMVLIMSVPVRLVLLALGVHVVLMALMPLMGLVIRLAARGLASVVTRVMGRVVPGLGRRHSMGRICAFLGLWIMRLHGDCLLLVFWFGMGLRGCKAGLDAEAVPCNSIGAFAQICRRRPASAPIAAAASASATVTPRGTAQPCNWSWIAPMASGPIAASK